MVDILLATYNGEKYIDRQIKSLVTQDRDSMDTDIRILIRDDGSTDKTLDIINKRLEYYRAKRPNPMEVVISQDRKPTGSPAANFMKLLSLSDAEYVMFSDQDDMWYRRKTAVTYNYMKRCEEKYGKETPILVHSDLSLMNAEGKKIADSFYDYQKLPKDDRLSTLLIQNTVTGCTMMLNKAAADLLRQAPAEEMLLMHDHYAAILIAATGKVKLIDEALIRYRQHSQNIVGAHAAGSRAEYKERFDLGRGKFLQDMDLSYRQAGYILKRYEKYIREAKGEDTVTMLREYSELIMADKLQRMEFFQKYGVYKNGLVKKAVQMIWC
ncbi:MAG: glycosyltransferase family 2 protein [Eubacterium sp.]|nr:glycosyltransferase family 2 protein [Eubacterium sp.]